MTNVRGLFLSTLLIAALCVVSSGLLSVRFSYPLPPARTCRVPGYETQDLAGVVAGLRRLGADIAWVQLLQFYGSPEQPLNREAEFDLSIDMTRFLFGLPVVEHGKPGARPDEDLERAEMPGGTYKELLQYCYRVVNLDPFFSYVYLYGAGALAWNQDRPQEALDLLSYGVAQMERYSPNMTRDIHQPYWQLHLYISTIMYKQSGDSGKMLALLQTAAQQPAAPNMVKVVLANIYQKNGNPAGALGLWVQVYESGDPTYRSRSEQKIEELRQLLHL